MCSINSIHSLYFVRTTRRRVYNKKRIICSHLSLLSSINIYIITISKAIVIYLLLFIYNIKEFNCDIFYQQSRLGGFFIRVHKLFRALKTCTLSYHSRGLQRWARSSSAKLLHEEGDGVAARVLESLGADHSESKLLNASPLEFSQSLL